MKKAKTQNKLVVILSVLLGAVFAFSIGFTFASNMQVIFGTNPKSTTAYLANQQHQLINTTEIAPIVYSQGIHSTEIALQYSYGYNFDLRIKYSLDWLGDDENNQLSTDNVELLFANRDNVIVDEKYIYFINYKTEEVKDEETDEVSTIKTPSGISAGSGRLSLITGVEIIETNNDEYIGKALAVKIEEVKIYKESDSYSDSHALYTDAYVEKIVSGEGENEVKEKVYSEAAKAWLRYKQSSNYNNAYAMVYNYRYEKSVGVSYPGHDSAYMQTINEDGDIIGVWLGGNRAYAGVGIYIITGKTPITLTASAVGTWRSTELESSSPQFDNSILLNYNTDWVKNNLTNSYNYIIPANTACYIKLLDNIEITSKGVVDSINDKETFKLVVRNITLNNAIFNYDNQNEAFKIRSAELNVVTISESDTRENYTQKDVLVLNTSEYSNNLYDYTFGTDDKKFVTSTMMLVNNTNDEQQVQLDYSLNYHISNGSTDINSIATAFSDAAFFRYVGSNTEDLTAPTENVFTIAPNSSVLIPGVYTVKGNFQNTVKTVLNLTDEYCDVWVDLNAEIVEVEESVESKDLLIEFIKSGSNGVVRIKNNTNKIVNEIDLNIDLISYEFCISSEAIGKTLPDNWAVRFWQYYYYDDETEKYIQNEKVDLDYDDEDLLNSFYYGYFDDDIESINTTITGLNLKPNESYEVYTQAIEDGCKYYISGKAEAVGVTEIDDVVLVKDNVNQKYIVNYSSDSSYYVRFNGTIAQNTNLGVDIITGDDGLNYIIMIVRPGQIIKVVSDTTEIAYIECENKYVAGSTGSLKAWVTDDVDLTNVLAAFDKYFS